LIIDLRIRSLLPLRCCCRERSAMVLAATLPPTSYWHLFSARPGIFAMRFMKYDRPKGGLRTLAEREGLNHGFRFNP
jgi:hypothetical protein